MKKLRLVFIIVMVVVAKADEQNCRFGLGCRYDCNCAGTCRPQTGCVGNCTPGWDGPTCQRHNVALEQPTSQSSDYLYNEITYASRLAVDGEVGHDLLKTPCTHTQPDTQSWWMVTLNRTYSIYRFQIYNRVGNCGSEPYKPCGSRINNFTLSVGTNNQSYSTCYTDTTTSNDGPGNIINGTCDDGNPRTGNTVRISLPEESQRPLTLCEVRLFVCSEGWYGEMCDKECETTTNCTKCHSTDSGLPCQRCVSGRWGAICDQDCGHCWNNTACDKDTGRCLHSSHRCEAGYEGDNCTTPCAGGQYGPDCEESCGNCREGQHSCYPTSGHCPAVPNKPSCMSGYTGADCKTPGEEICRFGTGQGCRYDCNCDGKCYLQTGCVGNCERGWDGPTCQRRNVALDQQTSQISNFTSYSSDLAVDGKVGHHLETTPCTHTQPGNQSWWMVTLNWTYNIYRFQIYNRVGDCGLSPYKPCGMQLNNFTLSVGTNNQSYSTCYTDTTTSDDGPGDIINGTCNDGNPITGNTVLISLPTESQRPLTLCEVLLFVCSEGWYGEMCDKECERFPNCTECDVSGLICQRCVSGLWGTDCDQDCGHCWNNTACDKDTGQCLHSSPRCDSGFEGDNCTTPCDTGKWGDNCVNTCSEGCINPACKFSTGVCEGECHSGYTGERCDTALGDNCVNTCSGNSINVADNATTGAGEGECHPGYTGERYNTECPRGTYGVLCRGRCGECLDGNHTCDHVNGTCVSCAAGWRGYRCKEVAASLARPANETPGGAIAGGVFGSVLPILVVVVVVLILRRRRRGPSQNDPDSELQPRKLEIRHQHDNPGFQHNIEYEDEEEDCVVNAAYTVNSGAGAENTCISVEEFRQYMLRKKASDGFSAEFETFPVGLHAKHDVADQLQNKIKSRYRNLVAYDHSRVRLKQLAGQDTDYINACYINGYNEPNKFIASQGPTDVIINEFLRMIWEQNTGTVVMLTSLVEKTKTKCLQYWPDEGSKHFGDVEVSVLDQEDFSNYVIRTLQLKHQKVQDTIRIVKQFHFTAWPDHEAPSNASGLLDFLGKVQGYESPLNGPIVVHCSAGIGRTGTFIALDYLINQAKEEGVVDVPACVRLLREQRLNMVQSLEQYEFLHEALAEALELQEGSIPGVDFSSVFADLCTVNPDSGQLKIAEQFQDAYLKRRLFRNHRWLYTQRLNEKMYPLDKSTLVTALHQDNLHKNRSSEIVAGDNCRPYLSTPVAGHNNYINAVFLPAYNKKRGFIITQTPLRETVVDFWRLVYDHSITTIVMLDDVENEYEDVGIYWPEKRQTFGPFDVKFIQKEEQKGFTVWTYNVAYKDMMASLPIKQFRCGVWSSTPSVASIPYLLAFIDDVTRWHKEVGNQPVLVHCRDGLTRSGLYCAASFVIERLKLDRDVNIPQAIKEMRVARPQIITDLNQFIFLHQVAMGYLETAHTYANFK